jgi:LacI family transcriptional regulator
MPTQGRPPSRTPGQRKPTINDVALAAGVSKKTVSRVINKSPLVKAETRAKVDAAIVDLGFSPDPLARALAMRRSRSA